MRQKECPDQKVHKNEKFEHPQIMLDGSGQIWILRSFGRSKLSKTGKKCEIVKSFFFAVFVKSTGHIVAKICTVYHINIIKKSYFMKMSLSRKKYWKWKWSPPPQQLWQFHGLGFAADKNTEITLLGMCVQEIIASVPHAWKNKNILSSTTCGEDLQKNCKDWHSLKGLFQKRQPNSFDFERFAFLTFLTSKMTLIYQIDLIHPT